MEKPQKINKRSCMFIPDSRVDHTVASFEGFFDIFYLKWFLDVSFKFELLFCWKFFIFFPSYFDFGC